ncbi:MAG: phage portal protein [Chloroflexi bacterium]|nr:phage portal protein [Chloroflexota bacterium]
MALRFLPNLPTAVDATSSALRLRDAERLRRYREYQDFYEGKHWPGQSGQGQRTRLVLNYARAIVDKGASYLLGRGINFAVIAREDGPRAQTLARSAENLLYQVYQDNDLDAADLQGALNAGVLGDAAFKVFWDPAEERIRVVNVDPFGFFARWAGDDLGTLRQVDVCYRLSAADLADLSLDAGTFETRGRGDAERAASSPRVSVSPRPRVSNVSASEVLERWTAQELVVLVDGQEVRRGPNPYGVIPFVHVPNLQPPNQFWGVSDLRDVVALNRELDARMSDQSDIIRYHADPPVIFRGVTEHSDLAVGPGTVWDIPADAEVTLLEWRGQPAAVQEHLERLFRALYEVAETPRTAFGDSGRLLSGVALEVELRPIIQKTLRKRVFWEAALRRRNRLVLRLAQQRGLLPSDTPALATRVIWPPMVPRDDAGEVRNNVTLVAAGLRSHRTAMDALGEPDPEAELQRVHEDRRKT